MNDIRHLEEQNRQLSRELKQRLFELSLLYDISNSISYTLDYDNFLKLLMDSLHKLVDFDLCVSLVVLEGEENQAKMDVRVNRPMSRELVESASQRVIDALGVLRGTLIAKDGILTDIQGEVFEDAAEGGRIRSFFDVPFFVREKAVGLLNVASLSETSYSDDQIKLFYTLASQASATIERLQVVLDAEKSKMKAMVEGMTEGVVMFDEKDRLVILNAAAQNMLDYHPAQLDAHALKKFFMERGFVDSFEEIKEARRTPWVREIRVEAPARVIHMEAVGIGHGGDKLLGVVMIFRDVTREREISQMKDDFVSLVSHELRTPLAAMKAASDNLLDGVGGVLSDVQKNCLSVVQRNIDRLGRMISDLLDISRIEAGKIQLNRQETDITALIEDVLGLLREPAKAKGLDLSSSCGASLPRLSLDADKITQVITNLVGNAIKFTPAGGRITVVAAAFDDCVQIDVADTGQGIPPQDLVKVFDKFYQVAGTQNSQKVKGTGLGLPISKGIVEKHGGRIWARSERGQGSVFSFTLPLTADSLPPAA